MLIRGRFPISHKNQGGMAGISLWDFGQSNLNEEDYYKYDRDFYRRELEQKLLVYAGCLPACEFQQEAHFQNRESGAWSNLDLLELQGFPAFLLNNRYWAIHAPVGEADITDYENQIHLEWSVRETREAIDMAFRVFADAVVVHPGTYNLKSRRFWPQPDEALRITNNRRVMLNTSIKSLIDHFLYRLEEWQERLATFLTARRGLADELQGLFREYDAEALLTLPRYRLAAQILDLITREKLGVDLVRWCKNPERGVRLAIENVEPPNFIICTAGQLRRFHSRMVEMYQEAFEQSSRLPPDVFDRFRPGMVLDVAHLLNSKIVLSTPDHAEISHIFEDHDDLDRPFVSLPGEYPTDKRGQSLEPLLNKFVREGTADLLCVYVAGSRRTDRAMTTHDPIRAFREMMHLNPRAGGTGSVARYGLLPFDPEVELNLAEVIQVLGPERTYLMKLFDLAPERMLASFNNLVAYLEFLKTEELRAR
ncbi:MAG: hypothetical protein HY303_13280 [Candidatus Wallbacteria bacterium]|nr:hypothetical protein [Candidatus Wallbacteria bacterium]